MNGNSLFEQMTMITKAHADAIIAQHRIDKLVAAAEKACDAMLSVDPDNPANETGWTSDELREAWVALSNAIDYAKPTTTKE